MRSYLCVALTVLVLAADHTLASDTPSDTAGTPPMMNRLKVSKENITEKLITNLPEEPAPSAQNKTTAIFVDFNEAKSRNNVFPPFTFDDNPNLEWQWFSGSVPNGAVGFWNSYTQRYENLCRAFSGCETGFYHSGYGDYCFFARYPKLWYTNGFYVLVNKDEFAYLEWKWGSYGYVPENSVRTCLRSEQDYVGKNQYGLGLVYAGDSFYLPWLTSFSGGTFRGYTTWYRKSYLALTINTDVYEQVIKDVEYYVDQSSIIETPPFAVDGHSVNNKGCNDAIMTVTLSTEQTKTNTWQLSYSMTLATSTTFTVRIPVIVSVSVDVTIGVEQTFQTTEETSLSQSQTNSLQVQITVPPNKKCTVKMQGRKFTLHIPFKARLGRTYSSGETKWTTVYGTYEGVQVADYNAVIERCEPLADPLPCGE